MKIASSTRIILIKEEKLRILNKLNTNVNTNTNIQRVELETYLKYIEEQIKIYPELKCELKHELK
jgi:hypothetical protein